MLLEETYTYREIHEQPQVLARLLERERPAAQALAAALRQRQVDYVLIAARGTSDNAARYAQYLWGAVNGYVVALATPSLFTIYHAPPRLGNALVVGISQSGKSPDIIAVLAEARRQGALTAVITNAVNSELARQGDFVLDLGAGEERAVAATKTYTAELAAIALLSCCLAEDGTRWEALRAVPDAVAATLSAHADMTQVTRRYYAMRHCVVLGRGYNYGSAFEIALKLKELTYTVVEPYSSADFLHGPLAVIEAGFPVLVVAPSGLTLNELRHLVQMLRERGAEVLAISDDAELLSLAHTPLPLPQPLPEWLSPLTCVLPGQLLAMHLAYARHGNPDQPRGLRKVTETM
ncbi:MAG: SIS domain-containing protein [Anaerolineae bacterium]|nr:SIS domain-containing protein [Anaerolineae bacterium]MDW8071470.1 SIS domain-containing protein [Anaerolineae bacterium]